MVPKEKLLEEDVLQEQMYSRSSTKSAICLEGDVIHRL